MLLLLNSGKAIIIIIIMYPKGDPPLVIITIITAAAAAVVAVYCERQQCDPQRAQDSARKGSEKTRREGVQGLHDRWKRQSKERFGNDPFVNFLGKIQIIIIIIICWTHLLSFCKLYGT